MQKVIDHHSVTATRTELVIDDGGHCLRTLHVDTRLVLTPDTPSYSEHAVAVFIDLVDDFRQRHAIAKVVLHECD